MDDPEGRAPPTLNRSLSPAAVMMLAFSALSPVSSVYLGGDAVLHMAGSGAAIAYVLGGVITALLTLLFAEIGAAVPTAGATYPAVARTVGPIMAFPSIVLGVPAAFVFVAFTALGLADYVRVLAPAWPELATAFAALAAATAIALLRVRLGALVTGIFLAIEAAALALLMGVALLHPVRPVIELLTHPTMLDHGAMKPVSLFTLGLATVAGVWSTAGASWALYFAEEMKDAHRQMGRVVAWTGFIASFLIAGPVVLVLLSAGNLPAILATDAPIATYLAATGGPIITLIVSTGVIAAIFNNLIAASMGLGRYLYATGRDGTWPAAVNRILAYVEPRHRTPVISTLIIGVGGALAMLLGERALVVFISGDVSSYLLISLAVLLGRRTGKTGRFYASPFYPVLPLFGLVFTAAAMASDWLDPDAGRPSTILLTTMFVGAMIYYRVRFERSDGTWLPGASVEEAATAS